MICTVPCNVRNDAIGIRWAKNQNAVDRGCLNWICHSAIITHPWEIWLWVIESMLQLPTIRRCNNINISNDLPVIRDSINLHANAMDHAIQSSMPHLLWIVAHFWIKRSPAHKFGFTIQRKWLPWVQMCAMKEIKNIHFFPYRWLRNEPIMMVHNFWLISADHSDSFWVFRCSDLLAFWKK